ncbi:hypothetical protein [Acrocarpospora sp. B8E8]|uniref:hypothetical protein n=1 Tax=Acrocarpospora sp. B8E8 TaxID=3153572 RepID=UPI00325C8C37
MAVFQPREETYPFGADDFSYLPTVLPGLMMFVGVDTGERARLHGADFLPPDEAVTDVAPVMLAGYLAAEAE